MYVLIVYDVEARRTRKFHDECQEYLTWIQNSVFEGELSPGKLLELKENLAKMLRNGENIVIYTWKTSAYGRIILGNAPDPAQVIL
jgi:CRISPR-associated protein Cas2